MGFRGIKSRTSEGEDASRTLPLEDRRRTRRSAHPRSAANRSNHLAKTGTRPGRRTRRDPARRDNSRGRISSPRPASPGVRDQQRPVDLTQFPRKPRRAGMGTPGDSSARGRHRRTTRSPLPCPRSTTRGHRPVRDSGGYPQSAWKSGLGSISTATFCFKMRIRPFEVPRHRRPHFTSFSPGAKRAYVRDPCDGSAETGSKARAGAARSSTTARHLGLCPTVRARCPRRPRPLPARPARRARDDRHPARLEHPGYVLLGHPPVRSPPAHRPAAIVAAADRVERRSAINSSPRRRPVAPGGSAIGRSGGRPSAGGSARCPRRGAGRRCSHHTRGLAAESGPSGATDARD